MTIVERPSSHDRRISKKNPDPQTHKEMESITSSSHVIPRCSKKLRFDTLTPTTHGRSGQHRHRRPSVELRVFTPFEKQIIQQTRRTLHNLCRNSTNQQLRCRAWAKDVPEVGYMFIILTVTPTVMLSTRVVSPPSPSRRVVSPHSLSTQVVAPHSPSTRLVSPHSPSALVVAPHPASVRVVSPHPLSARNVPHPKM